MAAPTRMEWTGEETAILVNMRGADHTYAECSAHLGRTIRACKTRWLRITAGQRHRGFSTVSTHPLLTQIFQEANDRGLNLEELAARAGLTGNFLQTYRRRNVPGVKVLEKLAAGIGMKLALVSRDY